MTTPTQTRERIHQLVGELPEGELPNVERFLRQRQDRHDPVRDALLNAPEDDEPLTPEDVAAIQEGLDAIERGETVSHHEVRRRLLGL